MNFIYPAIGLLIGLLLMVSSYYLYSCITWLCLRRSISGFAHSTPSDQPKLSSFIAHRVKLGRSYFGIRDCFFKISAYLSGIELKPWLPMPRTTSIYLPWESLSIAGINPPHSSHYVIEADTGNIPVTITVTTRQLKNLEGAGFPRKMNHKNKANKAEMATPRKPFDQIRGFPPAPPFL